MVDSKVLNFDVNNSNITENRTVSLKILTVFRNLAIKFKL